MGHRNAEALAGDVAGSEQALAGLDREADIAADEGQALSGKLFFPRPRPSKPRPARLDLRPEKMPRLALPVRQ